MTAGFFLAGNDAVRRAKRCAKCRHLFSVDGFAEDVSTADRRQSYCRRCKDEWEAVPENAWKRFYKEVLIKEDPLCLSAPHGWTRALYLSMWDATKGRCTYCGGGLADYQSSGHRLDRLDSALPHTPQNCRLCCWPCNRLKLDMTPPAFVNTIRHYVKDYGEGKVPWHTIYPGKFRPRARVDMTRFWVPDPQLTMFGGSA